MSTLHAHTLRGQVRRHTELCESLEAGQEEAEWQLHIIMGQSGEAINCLENIWSTDIWKITCLKEIGRQTPRFCKVIKGRDRRSLRSSHDSFSPEEKLFFISALLWSTAWRIKPIVLHMLDTTEQSPSLSFRMFYFILCDCACMWICPCHSAYVHIKGQLVGVSYFPLPWVFLGLNSGQRAWCLYLAGTHCLLFKSKSKKLGKRFSIWVKALAEHVWRPGLLTSRQGGTAVCLSSTGREAETRGPQVRLVI